MTSAIRDLDYRNQFKALLRLINYDFGIEGKHKDKFELFSSQRYGKPDLMFTDVSKELMDVSDVGDGSRDTYYTWVGKCIS